MGHGTLSLQNSEKRVVSQKGLLVRMPVKVEREGSSSSSRTTTLSLMAEDLGSNHVASLVTFASHSQPLPTLQDCCEYNPNGGTMHITLCSL